MTEELKRPRGGGGRRGVFRRPKRAEVPVGPADDRKNDGDDGDDAGSAGVREPRNPMPPGPRAAAGELPVPEPHTVITLPDPRL
jgi:hypothetical protein